MRLFHSYRIMFAFVLLGIIVLPFQAFAWHFEVISAGGKLFAWTGTGYEDENSFTLGAVTAQISDAAGSAYAHSNLLVGGDSCSFFATASGSASGWGGMGEAYVGYGPLSPTVDFVLRVTADEGDQGQVFLDLYWQSDSDGVDGFPCGCISRVEAGLTIEGAYTANLSTHSEDGPEHASDATSIGPVQDGTLITFSGFLWGAAGTMDFCSRTATSTCSIHIMLSEGTIPVEETTWGMIKQLYR
ncbi:MAG: hypothetical protein ABIA59_11420 [Candidatus Latescibacterota bacterium]